MLEVRSEKKWVIRSQSLKDQSKVLAPALSQVGATVGKPLPEKRHDVTCLFQGPHSGCRERAEAREPVQRLSQ